MATRNRLHACTRRPSQILESLESRLLLAVHTWTGAVSTAWSVAGNWAGGAPAAGETDAVLIFPGSAGNKTNVNDIANLTLQQVQFLGAGYQLFGQGVTLRTGGFYVGPGVAGASALALDLDLPQDTSVTLDPGGNPPTFSNAALILAGALSGAGALTTSGNVTLAGNAPNTNAAIRAVAGVLTLAKTGGAAAVGVKLVAGGGAGQAYVVYSGNDQVADGASVLVNTHGALDLAGHDDAFTDLAMDSSSVTTGNGFLRVLGVISATDTTAVASISGRLVVQGTLTLGVARTADPSAEALTPTLWITADISEAAPGGVVRVYGTARSMVELGGNNTYTGETQAHSGILSAASAAALGTPAGGTRVHNGGQLRLATGVTIVGETVTLTGSSTLGERGALVAWGGAATWDGPIVVDGAATIASYDVGDQLLVPGNRTITGTGNASSLVIVSHGSEADSVGVAVSAAIQIPVYTSGTVAIFSPLTSVSVMDGHTSLTSVQVAMVNGGVLEIFQGGSADNVTLNVGPANVKAFGSADVRNLAILGNGALSGGTSGEPIRVTDAVNLTGFLDTSEVSLPARGQSLTLIDNLSANPVAGTFAGLPEGAAIERNGLHYAISYVGGDGNDVTIASTDPALVTPTIAAQAVRASIPTLHVTVSGSGAVPTGTVTLWDASVLGSIMKGSATLGADGSADIVAPDGFGTRTLITYSGDTTYASATTGSYTSVPPIHLYAAGADTGGAPRVVAFDALTGQKRLDFLAYDPAFGGGVRVAVADFNSDGADDIVTAPGPGGGPHIKIFSGVDGSLISQFLAYTPDWEGGAFVATARFFGSPAVITGADAGGGPLVEIFTRDGGVLGTIYAFDTSFHGGVRVAAGDVNGDGQDDIIAAAGPGGGPHVQVFDGFTGAITRSFFAYDAAFRGGVYVAAGDTNGDGKADIITGAGPGGGPHVQVLSGDDTSVLQSYFAFDPTFRGGVRVAAENVDGDGAPDIVTAAGPGSSPYVQVHLGKTLQLVRKSLALDASFPGGLFVG